MNINYSNKSGKTTAGIVEYESSKKEGEWKHAEFSVNDFSEDGIFTQGAQIQIVCTSGEPIFHMIEVLKRQ